MINKIEFIDRVELMAGMIDADSLYELSFISGNQF